MARVNFVDWCYEFSGYDRNSKEESKPEALFRQLATARRDMIACMEEDVFGVGDPEELAQCKARYANLWNRVIGVIGYYIYDCKLSDELDGIYDIILDIREEGWMASDYQECADFLEELTRAVDLNALIARKLEERKRSSGAV